MPAFDPQPKIVITTPAPALRGEVEAADPIYPDPGALAAEVARLIERVGEDQIRFVQVGTTSVGVHRIEAVSAR